MTELAPVIAWVAGLDGSIEHINGRGRTFIGSGVDMIGGRPWVALVDADDTDRAGLTGEHALRTDTPIRLDCLIRRFDGVSRMHSLRVRPMSDERGVVVRWIGTATDIDDADGFACDPAASSTLTDALLSAASVGFALVDRNLGTVLVNGSLAAVAGSTVAQMLDQTITFASTQFWSQLHPLCRDVLDHGDAVVDVALDATKDCSTSVYPVSLGGGVIGVGILVFDTTHAGRAVERKQLHARLDTTDLIERRATQQALLASQRLLADAQRIAHVGSFEVDLLTGEQIWSEELYRILGIEPGVEPTDERFADTVHPDDLRKLRRAWAATTKHGTPFEIAYRVIRADGSGQRDVYARTVAEVDERGRVVRISGTLIDNTERVTADRVHRAAETRFEIGFEQAGIGAGLLDLNGIPIRVNPAVCAILGRPETLLVGQSWNAYNHPEEPPLKEEVLASLTAGSDTYTGERRYLRPDDSVVWTSLHITLVRDEANEPQYFLVQLQDITDRKELEQELNHQALHDALTGLPNRALLTDRLIHGLARSRRHGFALGVMFLDIDQFKVVNDSFGHGVGDDLLRHTASQIAAAIRPGDTVARFGGDEFVVVCDEVSVMEAEQIAERVLEAIGQPWPVGTQEIHVRASLGIAIADEHATPESLLRDSDAAMYRAKERGRARIEIFDETLRSKVEHRLSTASALHRALEQHEFTLHYQPIVDLSTGAMVSAEALLRWQHPARGLVSPDEFIPLAEETGLIVPIGAWVLEQACGQLVAWQRIQQSMATTVELSIAVNLSVRQLLDSDITRLVSDVLTRTALSPSDLCLELTESVFMEDVVYFETTLAGLKRVGVGLSIDDFGTGYSSLSYLKRFPVDAVKVDRAFVDGLGTELHDSALVRAIIAMADALGLEVTAEGVETHDQLAHLKTLQCPRAQGFYLARPMPAEALTRLVQESHRWPVD